MFVLSVLFVLISSYLFLSVLHKKTEFKNHLGFIFYILFIFCQIILSFEALSLFKLISANSLFVVNIIFLIISLTAWLKNDKHLYRPEIKEEFKKIIKALKKDKVLFFTACCFCVFIVSMLIVALFFPVKYGDALGYYLSRCTNWIQNGSLQHYITTDSRELIMPVNSELTYMWVLLFLKNEIGIAVFPFIFYLNTIVVIYNFLGTLGFCRRKRLWSVFVFSSLALVYVECAIPGADLWIGSLMLTSIYLFFIACKSNKIFLLYFSALSYALATGTKTTSIIAFPAAFVLLFIIAYLYNKQNIKKYLGYFIYFFILNFLIFSAYNYILNFIDFMNPISNQQQLLLNKFRGGFKGYLSNLIKYAFGIFDFSGIIDFFGTGKFIILCQDKVLAFFGLHRESFSSPYFPAIFAYTPALGITDSLMGIPGLIAFYPAIIYSVISAVKKKISKRTILLASLALFYIINILIFARVMVFTMFNMRYLLAFAVVSSPVLVYTYIKSNKNFYKLVVAWVLFLYLAFNSHAQPLVVSISYLKYKALPLEMQVKDRHFILDDCDEFRIRDYLLPKQRGNIGIMLYQNHNPIYYIQKLRLNGFYMETVLPEIIKTYDLSRYDYIISQKNHVSSTLIKNFNTKVSYNADKCVYKDWNKNESEVDIPVVVACNIPYDYLKENGFEPVSDIYLNGYILFKRNDKNN